MSDGPWPRAENALSKESEATIALLPASSHHFADMWVSVSLCSKEGPSEDSKGSWEGCWSVSTSLSRICFRATARAAFWMLSETPHTLWQTSGGPTISTATQLSCLSSLLKWWNAVKIMNLMLLLLSYIFDLTKDFLFFNFQKFCGGFTCIFWYIVMLEDAALLPLSFFNMVHTPQVFIH